MPENTVDQIIDTSGLQCPLPLIKAKKALMALPAGSVLQIISTDAAAPKDFEAFAKLTGHILLETNEQSGKYYFLLKKT